MANYLACELIVNLKIADFGLYYLVYEKNNCFSRRSWRQF